MPKSLFITYGHTSYRKLGIKKGNHKLENISKINYSTFKAK